MFSEAMEEVGGTTLLLGDTERYFIGGGDWDAVLVNHFPNRQAFIATLNHRNYKDMSRHRDASPYSRWASAGSESPSTLTWVERTRSLPEVGFWGG